MRSVESVRGTGENTKLAPHPSALIESLRSIGYTLETALADIIDNSITAGAATISTQFMWSDGSPWIAIVDDGCGMAPNQLRDAMRFGSMSPLEKRREDDLGRFGLGMKTASISQCRQLTVVSLRDQVISACEWDLDLIAQSNSDDWVLGQLSEEQIRRDGFVSDLIDQNFRDSPSGTIILWRNLDCLLAGSEQSKPESKFSENMNSAREHIELVFHRFLSPDAGRKSTKMNFNGSRLEAFNPFGPQIPARQELTVETITLEGSNITVQPYVLPHHSKVSAEDYKRYAGEAGYLQNQGFYIYRNRRLIVKATWFRLIRKEELNKLIRVRIDIPNSLDHLWNINVDKSQLRPPESVRKQLRKIISKIAGAGKLVFKRRSRTLQNRNMIAVWKREVFEGKIRYCINEEHPLLNSILEEAPDGFHSRISTCIQMINRCFPYDIYYADAANDEIEFVSRDLDEAEIRSACEKVIEALRICGLKGEELRNLARKTEIPGATLKLIDELLEEST